MDQQTREARAMVKDMPPKEKIKHIWLYYKWWIIGVLAAIILIGGTVHEVMTRPTYDLEIGFYSEKYYSDETIAAMEVYIAQFVEDTDLDGNRTVKIHPVSLSMMGNNAESEMAVQTKFMAEMSSGAYSVFLFDDVFYDAVQSESYQGTMESLRDIQTAEAFAQAAESIEGTHIYWGTRALYETEKGHEDKILAHDRAVQIETQIFGARETE